MTEILPRIEQAIQRVVQLVTALPPAATEEPLLPGDRSVKESVAAGLAALIAEHRAAIETFGTDTREETVRRAAENRASH